MREGQPVAGQSIEVRRFDLIIAKGMNGLVTLVVGEDEQDVGLVG